MGPLPCTDNGTEYILVVTDYFSEFVKSFALPNHTALTVTDKIVTEVICRYGAIQQIHSNTSPYRRQCNGLVERCNRTLQQMLTVFCSDNQSNSDDYLPYLMMACRASTHARTKCSPNLLMFGQEVRGPIDLKYVQ